MSLLILSTRRSTQQKLSLLSRLGRWLTDRYRIWRDERLLANRPDYLLKDIGLSRADIPSALRGEKF